jgi:uncharacterized membrane protein HdeD (DUF308 family)
MLVTNPFRPGTFSRAQIDAVSAGWWALLLMGIISAVAGGVILITDWSVDDLATFIGILLVVHGIVLVLSVPLDGGLRLWSAVSGLIEVAVGVAVFAWPGPTLLVIAAFIGFYVLFSGLMTIAGSITWRDVVPYWGLMLAFGILETLFATWLLVRPDLTIVAAVLAIGFWSLFYGVMQIALAFEVKRLPSRADALAQSLDNARSRTFEPVSTS